MRQTLIALGMFFSLSAGLRAARPAVPPVVLKETVLKNGLKVILAPDKTAPVVAIAVTYRVGAKDERPGRTGFAHLFEHMMFQGSANIGKGEHFSLVETNGGDFNGTTSEDRTNYFESLPKNQLDLLLFLEADRMRALNITKANFENQREVVKEERRMNYDNRPYGRSYAEIDNLAYDNFAYKHPVIGHMSDLNAAALEDVQEFFRIYYAPNNASLVLAGDFEPEDALRRVRDRFESIPAQPEPPRPDLAEPEHFGERREMLYDKLARVPMILIMYHIPPGDTPDNWAMQVLARVLGEGKSSRLYESLVKDKELATDVKIYPEMRIGPSGYYVEAMLRPGIDPDKAVKAIDAVLERAREQEISPAELAKARKMFRREMIGKRQTAYSTAIQIGHYEGLFRDPSLINTAYDKFSVVDPKRVKESAQKYLNPRTRAVLITLPDNEGQSPQGPSKPSVKDKP